MTRHRIITSVVLSFAIAASGLSAPASASVSSKSYKSSQTLTLKKKKRHVASKSRSSRVAEDRSAALVVDASTGKILFEKNAGAARYPASLTKMMTLYLTFDALKKGTITLDQTFAVTAKAAGQPQTNIALNQGDRLPVKTAIESVVVRSANDSAMVLAEGIGGTEWNFALQMTQKAHELGMKDTVFRNPNGLPDNQQHTTAYDLARLAIALRRDFPEYYPYFKLQSCEWNGVTYPGHNRVMSRYDGVDGIKTGFIRASGFNLVTSVKKDGFNLVAVVMGGSTANARDNQMIALLNRTIAQLEEQRKNSVAANDNKKNLTDGSGKPLLLSAAE